MEKYHIIWNLLQKIKTNLIELQNSNPIYKNTLNNLNIFMTHNSKNKYIDDYQQITKIFIECYHDIINSERNNNLTVKQTILLNNLDELEDVLITQ